MSLSLSFLSLSLSSCFCSVSIYSPLRCCTSPQLPVFSSCGLFSLHLSLFLHSLRPLPPVLYPSICSRLYSCLCERYCELSQHRTLEQSRFTERHNAQRKNNCSSPPSSFLFLSCYSPPVSLASAHSCALSVLFHISLTCSPLKIQ